MGNRIKVRPVTKQVVGTALFFVFTFFLVSQTYAQEPEASANEDNITASKTYYLDQEEIEKASAGKSITTPKARGRIERAPVPKSDVQQPKASAGKSITTPKARSRIETPVPKSDVQQPKASTGKTVTTPKARSRIETPVPKSDVQQPKASAGKSITTPKARGSMEIDPVTTGNNPPERKRQHAVPVRERQHPVSPYL